MPFLKEQERQNKLISTIVYVQHPKEKPQGNESDNKSRIALLDVARDFESIIKSKGIHITNVYNNRPEELLEKIIESCTKNNIGSSIFTNLYFSSNKVLIEEFLMKYTQSSYNLKDSNSYREGKLKEIDFYSVKNLFTVIDEVLAENSDKFYKVFSVRLIQNHTTANCLEFTLNLEELYKFLPNYNVNLLWDYNLVYSLMLVWCAIVVYSWLNALAIVPSDAGIFLPVPRAETLEGLPNYSKKIESIFLNKEEEKQELKNIMLNNLFEVLQGAICSSFSCACDILFPISTFNLFGELRQIANDNKFYTTKHDQQNSLFEFTIKDSYFIPIVRHHFSCMYSIFPKEFLDGINVSDDNARGKKVKPPIRLILKSDNQNTNLIHASLEVNNHTGFYYLLSLANKGEKDDGCIYACTLWAKLLGSISDLIVLLLSSYILFNDKEKKKSVQSFYDKSLIDYLENELKTLFPKSPHNRYSLLSNTFKFSTLAEFKEFIREELREMRNLDYWVKIFSKGYFLVKKKTKNSKYVNALEIVCNHAHEVISC